MRPVLWNVFYDKFLDIQMPPGVKIIVYVDNMMILVKGCTGPILEQKNQYCGRSCVRLDERKQAEDHTGKNRGDHINLHVDMPKA